MACSGSTTSRLNQLPPKQMTMIKKSSSFAGSPLLWLAVLTSIAVLVAINIGDSRL
ncbi:hypothetical protein Dimus_010003 [Dionaea muscipula]